MDRTESIVAEYLAHHGFQSVVHEPDGNCPPDFSIHGRTAVEARRLNQNEQTSTGARGLEELSIPLGSRISRFIETVGSRDTGESWYVFFSIRRPVPSWKHIRKFLQDRLTNFANQASREDAAYVLDRGFEIEIQKAGKTWPTLFVLGGSADDDSGGFVLSEMARNIRICVDEKARKVAPFRSRYPEWWLALVDHIGYGLNGGDRAEIRKILGISDSWDKILLINPLDGRRGFEL